MKTRIKIFLLCLLMAGGATKAFGQTVMQMGITTDTYCKYGLYYSYFTFNGYKFGESYYATIYDFVGTYTSVTVPATIEYGGHVYSVCGISDDDDLAISLEEKSVINLTFEGDVTMWGSPIKVKPGIFGFGMLKFNGRSFPFDGDISNYFTSSSLNNVRVSLSDKTESQITELKKKAPWNQFYSVTYTPIHLNLATNITLCPQTNYSEDVALYSLGDYESFADANYDLSKLTLMNYSSPGVYEIDKYQNYVLVARYDKNNVDCHYVRNGYESGMGTFNFMDYDEFLDVKSDITLDLSFTWKTSSIDFIQANGLEDITYRIVGNKPMSGILSQQPISTLSGTSSGDRLTLTLPSTRTLNKVVMLAGDTEQTISAPEPVNGNYTVNLTVPTEKKSYVYVYWQETKTSETFKLIRHGGGNNHTWMMWDDGGVYDYYFEEGASEVIIPKEQLTTDMQMYINVKPGETFKVYKDGEDITSAFKNNYNPTEYWMELDKKSATYTVIYEQTEDIIEFADAAVEAICVENWDTNGDGKLSKAEAAAVTDLGEVFKGNTDITSFDELQYFTGLTALEKDAFREATNLTSIVIPENVVRISGGWTFYGCTSLEKVVLPDNLTFIDSMTFCNTNIKSISLPTLNNLILGYAVFTQTPLKSLFIPEKVTTIYNYPAYNCPNLASISVDEANTIFDSREGCNAIIKTSTNTLIAGCKNTVIPESVTALAEYAFFKTDGLVKLELPAGLTSIGRFGIRDCTSLTTVVAHMPDPFAINTSASSNNYNISDLPANCKLIVPAGKRQAYIDAGWTTDIFRGGVVEAESDHDSFDVNGDGQVTIADVTKLVNKILGKE